MLVAPEPLVLSRLWGDFSCSGVEALRERVQVVQHQMDRIVDSMASLERKRQRDASPWRDMRGDAPASCSYNPGDSEQLPYDVPLPMGLIQDHPEPLLIDRRFITGSEERSADKDGQDSAIGDHIDFDTAAGSEDSGGGMPVCNAEPMTQEEAEAFDQTSMGSCFLEFGAFGMSQMSREGAGEATLRTPASQNAAEAVQRFQATGALPRPSVDTSSRVQASGSTEGDPSSNRSSFDMVPPATSSRLYDGGVWDGSCNAPEGSTPSSQQAMLERSAAAAAAAPDAQQQHIEDCKAAAQQAAKGKAPGSARAAHQALCMGQPNSRPRLALSQQELMQANMQQMHAQQGTPMQVQKGVPVQARLQQHQRRGTTPVLQQSTMQLSLGMGLGLTLDLGSWCYGTTSEGAQADVPGGVQGGGGTPRASAATHRRRAGAPVEDYPSDKVPAEQQQPGDMLGWPLPAGVAAASLQNVRSNHIGAALTVADLLGLPAKVQQAQGMPRANFPQHPVKQEAPQHRDSGVVVPRPIEEVPFAAEEASLRNNARMPCKIGGQELSVRHESLERYRDKKRRRMFSNAKTIRYEKRKVNADRRPRVKGRFVKQMDVDAGLEMIKEHAQLPPPPECDMEHASDGDCSGDDEDPSHTTVHCSDHRA
ncbi:probable zinc finger protein CONSTANS-LIKE 8 at C-terminar half [Coccomyxa sp. Obi]|nr:probable zinc finger protein CONSTANS-LIKE 8 at C-terminar half [Coccomyxa sp. Obi]